MKGLHQSGARLHCVEVILYAEDHWLQTLVPYVGFKTDSSVLSSAGSVCPTRSGFGVDGI